MIGIDGQERRVLGVQQWYEEEYEVRNLTVDNNHSFAVGSDALLVHNTAGCTAARVKDLAGQLGVSPSSIRNTVKEANQIFGSKKFKQQRYVIQNRFW